MSTRAKRDFLKVQLLEIQHLRELAKGHPLMEPAYAEREQEIREEIDSIPLGAKEPRTVLFFSGEPVQGSQGIDANFAARVLEPFQQMVCNDYANRWHGAIGARGKRAGESQSRLLLTGLPRGSFGLELTKAENDELFDEDHLSQSLAHVTKLVEAASRSDEDFAVEIEETSPRVIPNLRRFLEVVAKGHAGLRMETGDFRCEMNPVKAEEAFNRVDSTITNDDIIKVAGVFKGSLLESWRFDFVDENNHKISGPIDDDLTEEQAGALTKSFFNQPCVGTFQKSTVIFKNGSIRTTHTLKSLEPMVG